MITYCLIIVKRWYYGVVRGVEFDREDEMMCIRNCEDYFVSLGLERNEDQQCGWFYMNGTKICVEGVKECLRQFDEEGGGELQVSASSKYILILRDKKPVAVIEGGMVKRIKLK